MGVPRPDSTGNLFDSVPIVATVGEKRTRDVMGRVKMSRAQNIYDADFEYGKQPLRWEEFTLGGGASITHQPGEGGVRMRVSSASGDVTIRQSRPYHRYQPGKSMWWASAVNFGVANVNQIQRVGYFDDSNGVFFEQAQPPVSDPFGMSVVIRSDAQSVLSNGKPTDTRFQFHQWSDPQNVKGRIDWTRTQMLWIEYAWYGAGAIRWGVLLDGEPIILHEVGAGNNAPAWTEARAAATDATANTITAASASWTPTEWVGRFVQYGAGYANVARVVSNTATTLTLQAQGSTGNPSVAPVAGQPYRIMTLPTTGVAWARTGNLPVRYEQRNTGASVQNDMVHYGVSVMIEGGSDEQRGFTYSYGMAPATPRRVITGAQTRFPVLTVRARTMGTQEYTQASSAITAGTTTSLTATGSPWVVDQWRGRFVSYVNTGVTYVARITSNTVSALTIENVVTGLAMPAAPVAGQNYTIGMVNRGQLLPRRLVMSCDQVAVVELISGSSVTPVTLTGATFAALASLGSANSFAERDVSATALSGGEVVLAFTSPAGGSGVLDLDLQNLFPLFNSIQGSVPDTLTVAVTTTATSNVGAHIVCQEAMS